MLYAVVPATLQDVKKSRDIAGCVHMRVFSRITNASLRREVHDALRFVLREYPLHRSAVREIGPNINKTVIAIEPGETRLLQPDIVVIVEIVETDNFIASLPQAEGQRIADKASCTRNKNLHSYASDETYASVSNCCRNFCT